MRRVLSIVAFAAILSGCHPSPSRYSAPGESGADRVYPYRATACDCGTYTFRDSSVRVEYRISAEYRMQQGIHTEITCTLVNRTRDTLYFERAAIRVSSRNVRYQYNDKFLPIPWDPLLPQSSATHKITGREVTDASDWNKIAGERLSVSFKGLSLSGRELVPQTVEFIPENPKIGN